MIINILSAHIIMCALFAINLLHSAEKTSKCDKSINKEYNLPSLDEVSTLAKLCVAASRKRIEQQNSWVPGQVLTGLFDDDNTPVKRNKAGYLFTPFIQKYLVNEGDIILIHGDLHGAADNLYAALKLWQTHGYLDPEDMYKIQNDKIHIIILGDLVDRGPKQIETLCIIWKLMINNRNIIVTRGNYEDISLNKHDGGLIKKIKASYLQNKNHDALQSFYKIILKFYDLLPLGIYIQIPDGNFILGCHGCGGLDVNAAPLLNHPTASYYMFDIIARNDIISNLKPQVKEEINKTIPSWAQENFIPTSPQTIRVIKELNSLRYDVDLLHFLWADIQVDPTAPVAYDPTRSWILSASLIKEILSYQYQSGKVLAILRGHQHTPCLKNPMMRSIYNLDGKIHADDTGISKLWPTENLPAPGALWRNIVCTFCLAPQTYESIDNFPRYDTWGLLQINKTFDECTLKAIRITNQ